MRDINNYSKDAKVELLSIEEFADLLYCRNEGNIKFWNTELKIDENNIEGFVCTNSKLIYVIYEYILRGVVWDTVPTLKTIYVAIRDGENEYKIFEEYLSNAKSSYKEAMTKKKASKSTTIKLDKEIRILEQKIKSLEKLVSVLPHYETIETDNKTFSCKDFMTKTDFKCQNKKLSQKYVVLDVETNGLRTATDDLLSISVLDPYNKICYNRFLPLDLQPLVLTTSINGITEDQLSFPHLTQNEFDELIETFDLNNRTILVYYGGKRNFDESFLRNYCKRHKIKGVDRLKFQNIKAFLPTPNWYSYKGMLSKDNLCNALGIKGVTSIHNSLNDCILEWNLFEKIYGKRLFFINDDIYEYNDDYIAPISYLIKSKDLREYSSADLPEFKISFEYVFCYDFPSSALEKIKKFPTNITGISLENSLRHLLGAIEEDNREFLVNNKKHINLLCSLECETNTIPISELDNGELLSLDSKYDDYIGDVNEVSKVIGDQLGPLVNFIKEEIFVDGKIVSQELVISEDGKVLALCDFSNKDSILEMKTFYPFYNEEVTQNIVKQLYFQSKGRDSYLLFYDFDRTLDNSSLRGLSIYIVKFKLIKK